MKLCLLGYIQPQRYRDNMVPFIFPTIQPLVNTASLKGKLVFIKYLIFLDTVPGMKIGKKIQTTSAYKYFALVSSGNEIMVVLK